MAIDLLPKEFIDCTNFFNQILSTFKFIETDETADWKTYRNEEYGFEVRYPEEFIFESRRDIIRDQIWLGGIYTEDKGNFGILVKEQKLNPDNIEGLYGKIDNVKIIEINNIKAYRYMEGDAGCGGYSISIPKDEITIKISFSDCKGQTTEIVNNQDQILSTFKFIEK